MKKLFYILASAVVALGAMACNNEFDENTATNGNGEKVSFVAEIGEATRVDIDDKVDGKYPISLDDEDVLTVQLYNDGEFGGNIYTFTSPDGVNYSCEKPGVSELLTGEVYAHLGEDDSFCSFCGLDGIGLSGYGFLSGADAKIKLEVPTAVLTFESSMDVTFKATDSSLFSCHTTCDGSNYNPNEGYAEITIPAEDGVRYVAVNGSYEKNYTFSYSIDGIECKSIDINFQPGKIYNLGTLVKPSAWNISGGHNNWSTTETPMYLEGNYFVARNVTLTEDGFQFNQGEWTKQVGAYQEYGKELDPVPVGEWYESKFNTEGYKSNITVTDISKKYDIYLLNSNVVAMFYIAESGSPAPETPTLPELNSYALAGTFNSWGDTPMEKTSTYGLFVAKNISLAADDEIKVKNATTWDESYGGSIRYMKPNCYIQVSSSGSNICIIEAGTYDIYFEYGSKLLYVVTAGTDYTTVAEQTEEGKEIEVTDNILYLKPNSNWTQANARFAAFFFGNGDTWVSMTDSDSDGIYEVHIPKDYTFGDNVIFCRMNPSAAANNWDNKWNQTADLKIPTDGKNLYTVKDGYWDSSDNNQWSVK